MARDRVSTDLGTIRQVDRRKGVAMKTAFIPMTAVLMLVVLAIVVLLSARQVSIYHHFPGNMVSSVATAMRAFPC